MPLISFPRVVGFVCCAVQFGPVCLSVSTKCSGGLAVPVTTPVVHAKTAEAKMPGLGLQEEGAAFASRDATHDRTAYTLPCPVGGCSEL